MSAAALLDRLAKLGVEIVVIGDDLRIRAERGALSDDLKAEIATQKPALLSFLAGRPTDYSAPLKKFPREAPAPPSDFQERLWIMHRLEPDATSHQFATLWPFAEVAAERLCEAVRGVVCRHDILRTVFPDLNGAPIATVGEVAAVPIAVVSLAGIADQECDRIAEEALAEELRTPFDLTRAPPMRFRVFDGGQAGSALLVCAHHIAVDDWSMSLLHQAVKRAIEATDEAAPEFQYADYAAWRRRIANQSVIAKDLAWHESRLAGMPEQCMFPPDRLGDTTQGSASVTFSCDAELTKAVRALAKKHGATLAMAAYAACATALRAHAELDDILLGIPLGLRERPEFETMIGPFVNLLVLRLDLADDPSFAILLERVRESFLDVYSHREAPFERLLEKLNPSRSFVRTPIFQVAVVVHNATDTAPSQLESGGAMHEVTWYVRETEGCIKGSLEYRPDLYDEETMLRVAARLRRVLMEAVAAPDKRINDYDLMDASERSMVVEGFNQTILDLDTTPFPQLFMAQALRTPAATAARCKGLEWTYEELSARAAGVARAFAMAGVGRGSRVGVCLERGLETLAAVIGVQLAGAAYVPLDPRFPPDRLAFMIADSGVCALLVDEVSRECAEGSGLPLLNVAETGRAEVSLAGAPVAEDTAYVIYTSGSTGRPNGVAITHGALSNFLQSMRREPGLSADDVFAAVTTISFDIAGLELFLPLIVGACIEIVPREYGLDGERLAVLLEQCGATVLQATPATWRLLLDAGWGGVQEMRALCGGEAMSPDLAAALIPLVAELWNLYGPTETTIWSAVGRIEAGDRRITVGRPIANTRIYVLNASRSPVPIGLPGEIWIGGAGIAAGYHERPQLSAERFVRDPFVSDPCARMYRTGDLGRWSGDGRLLCLGRRDFQMKVCGFRIEPGEIEAALTQHPNVRQALVSASQTGGVSTLVAYLVYEPGEAPTASDLRRFLRSRCPDYMVPALFVGLESMPQTPNGKIDRRALPDPFRAGRSVRPPDEPLAPGVEQAIGEVWRELLQVDHVGPHDNFFELGGHSLLSLRVVAAFERRIGWRMDPRALFFKTLREIAAGVNRERAGA